MVRCINFLLSRNRPKARQRDDGAVINFQGNKWLINLNPMQQPCNSVDVISTLSFTTCCIKIYLKIHKTFDGCLNDLRLVANKRVINKSCHQVIL